MTRKDDGSLIEQEGESASMVILTQLDTQSGYTPNNIVPAGNAHPVVGLYILSPPSSMSLFFCAI